MGTEGCRARHGAANIGRPSLGIRKASAARQIPVHCCRRISPAVAKKDKAALQLVSLSHERTYGMMPCACTLIMRVSNGAVSPT